MRAPRRVPRAAALALCAAAAVVPGAVAVATGDTQLGSDRGGSTPLTTVVTLGDSYSSGQGIHADASDYDDHASPIHSFDPATRLGGSACHRELDTTPGPRLADRLGAASVFAACAGARIDDISNQLDEAAIAGDGAGTLVAITVGGNDLRTLGDDDWPSVLLDCILSLRCDRDDDNQIANLDELDADLVELYTTIGTDHPEITVRVLGYPRLMQRERWGCPGVTGVGRREADWIDDQVDRLNDTIAAAVAAAAQATNADLAFVPVEDEFDNHGACRYWQRDRFVNDRITGETYWRLRQPDGSVVERSADSWFNISGSSFHPSQAGYDAYFDALAGAL